MKQINIIVSFYSLVVLLVIIERLSPTTKILLQPYNFIRLHEVIQTNILLLLTVILSAFIIKIITKDFSTLKTRWNFLFFLLFLCGTYLYGAGEGWHEMASFLFNHYCDTNHVTGNLCGGLFINDYYAGNLIFFIGGLLMNVSLITLAVKHPVKPATDKELVILLSNSVIYACTWIAYAAFDVVLLGLIFESLLMLISLGFFLRIKKEWKAYPYITYSAFAYTIATLVTLIIRFG